MEKDRARFLADCINEAVDLHGFRRLLPSVPSTGAIDWVAAWKRKTWNTNRGIALVGIPREVRLAGEYALDIRKDAGRAIGYLPFLYELGLQLVLCGSGIRGAGEDLARYVTPVNNSTVILQSIHLVDLDTGETVSARTWGQVVTGKWIDAIEGGIARYSAGAQG